MSLERFVFDFMHAMCVCVMQCVPTGAGKVVFTAPGIHCDDPKYNAWLPVVGIVLALEVILGPILILVFLHHVKHIIKVCTEPLKFLKIEFQNKSAFALVDLK